MMTDYHCHILPGIDDGAADLDAAMLLVRSLKSWGFEKVYCTPHITHKFRNTPDTIRPAFELLCESVQNAGIGMEFRKHGPRSWKKTG